MQSTQQPAGAPEAPLPEWMVPVDAPVPPMLEQAVRYVPMQEDQPARWLAIYWMMAGDEAYVTDGRVGHDGSPWGYLAFVRHPTVALHLARLQARGFDFGSSDSQATHYLVVDRAGRRLYAAPRYDAERWLLRQWGVDPDAKQEPLKLTPEELQAACDKFAEEMRRRSAEFGGRSIRDAIIRQRAVEQQMVRWMDETPQAARVARLYAAAAAGQLGKGEGHAL
jgi:hypothetical protein